MYRGAFRTFFSKLYNLRVWWGIMSWKVPYKFWYNILIKLCFGIANEINNVPNKILVTKMSLGNLKIWVLLFWCRYLYFMCPHVQTWEKWKKFREQVFEVNFFRKSAWLLNVSNSRQKVIFKIIKPKYNLFQTNVCFEWTYPCM